MIGLEFLELFGLGLAAGAIGALLGVGGGVILVPGLSLLLGLGFREAVAASLVCVVATSVAGSIVNLRARRVHLPLALQLQFFAVLGAVGGGLAAPLVPVGPLYLAFAALLAYSASQMFPRRRHPDSVALAPEALERRRKLAGVGGGVIFMPILHLLLRRPFIPAAATSVYMIGITASAGALVYLARGDVSAPVAGATIAGVLIGSGVAATVGHHLDYRWLKTGFALLLLFLATQMVRGGIDRL